MQDEDALAADIADPLPLIQAMRVLGLEQRMPDAQPSGSKGTPAPERGSGRRSSLAAKLGKLLHSTKQLPTPPAEPEPNLKEAVREANLTEVAAGVYSVIEYNPGHDTHDNSERARLNLSMLRRQDGSYPQIMLRFPRVIQNENRERVAAFDTTPIPEMDIDNTVAICFGDIDALNQKEFLGATAEYRRPNLLDADKFPPAGMACAIQIDADGSSFLVWNRRSSDGEDYGRAYTATRINYHTQHQQITPSILAGNTARTRLPEESGAAIGLVSHLNTRNQRTALAIENNGDGVFTISGPLYALSGRSGHTLEGHGILQQELYARQMLHPLPGSDQYNDFV